MYLKTLSLRGFKSFASATTLALEPGVTCVVGPNGSGKSNVVDALAWVMGEQGAKTLRGSNMADVIFAGTSSRKGLGRAEVQLTIDNTDGLLPIDYSEVTISRTMFTSGGSDYAINGTPVRLLDVQELLSDSGMGRQMHVIVGQGQLDQVLASGPGERRAFIEEAAGVLKHKKRKERALRKLDGMEVNLHRLQDLTNELGRQLGPLARQASAARKAQMIQAQLRDATARVLADELYSIVQRLEDAQASKETIDRRMSELNAKLAVLDTQLEAARGQLEDYAPGVEGATKLWQEFTLVSQQLTTVKDRAAERVAALGNATQEDPRDDLEAIQEKLASDIEQRDTLAENLDSVSQDIGALSEKVRSDQEAVDQARRVLASANRELADRRESVERLRGSVTTATQLLEGARVEGARLEAVYSEAQERIQATQAAVEAISTSSNDDVEAANGEHTKAVQALEDARSRVEELRLIEREAASLATTWQARRDALASSLSPEDATAALLRAGLPGVLEPLPALIEIEPGWEDACAAVFGSWAQAIVVESIEYAADAVRLMRDGEEGMVRLLIAGDDMVDIKHREAQPALPEDSVWALDVIAWPGGKGIPSSIYEALENVALCQTLAQARELIHQGKATIVATTSGDLLSAHRVRGGGKEHSSVLSQSVALKEAQEEALAAAEVAEDAAFALIAANNRVDEAQLNVTDALAKLRQSDQAAAARAEENARILAQSNAAKAEAERNLAAWDKAKENIATQEMALKKAEEAWQEAQNAQFEGKENGEEDAVGVAQEALAAAEAQAIRSREELNAKQLERGVLDERLRTAKARVESNERSLSNARRRQLEAQEREEKRVQRLTRAQHVFDQATHALGVAVSSMEAAEAAWMSAQQGREELLASSSHLQTERDQVAKAINQIGDMAHRDELALAQINMRREQILQKAAADLGTEEEELLASFGPHTLVPVLDEEGEVIQSVPFDRDQQLAQMEKAQKSLEKLGKVNPLALEEHQAMESRHQFLAQQLADIKKSRADLMNIVAEVDRQVEEVFTQAFEDVRKAFVTVFAKLFPGGEGALVLTDPADIQETGVDIEARPAGKKIKRLSLLSGGERSLAALAFLVAIFTARPSPFYVLDEVEAALDDANLTRLLSVFEDLKQRSQMIIITHHKRTMEVADALYGVTMRDGVSTVVSQRLEHPR
ncbi:MAG: chromosome segregation protein SMC [Actinomycetaceae bacterium]|nr:chromosome segregation protein SMC [Actinomycetaceae bacterium]